MPNDAKLGLLAGVAGVVLAAVLFYQNRHPASAPAPNPTATAATQLPRPGPSGQPGPTAVVSAGRPAPGGALRGRPEVEARVVSRPAAGPGD